MTEDNNIYYMSTPWCKMAIEYSQYKMGDEPGKLNWDRKNPELVGQFYSHMLSFLNEYYKIEPKNLDDLKVLTIK